MKVEYSLLSIQEEDVELEPDQILSKRTKSGTSIEEEEEEEGHQETESIRLYDSRGRKG